MQMTTHSPDESEVTAKSHHHLHLIDLQPEQLSKRTKVGAFIDM
jgi:hypothetical protein